MLQKTGNDARNGPLQNTELINSTTASPTLGPSEPQPILGRRNESHGFIFPEDFTDQEFEDLLNLVIPSPRPLASGIMVDALPTTVSTPTGALDLLKFGTTPQVKDGFEGPATSGEMWMLINEGGEPPAEKPPGLSVSARPGINGVNDSRSCSSPQESVIGNDTKNTRPEEHIDPDIVEYERSQDKQIHKLMSTITPLAYVIGKNIDEICVACFHVGHHHTEFDICPTGRIKSLFLGESEPFYNRFSEKIEAKIWLMKDISLLCRGMSWAVQYVCQGFLKEFQIFPSTISVLHNLLNKWKSVCHNEKFTFGKFGECGGEIIFGAPFKISLVEGDWGPYRQILPKSDIPKLKAPTGQNAETLNSPMTSFVGYNLMVPSVQPTRKKIEQIADRLKLDVIGNRSAAICNNCFHRGHAKNCSKICPYLVVSLALSKIKNGRKRLENVSKELECLEKVANGVMEPVERERVEPVRLLIAEWKEAVENFPKGKKSRVKPSKTLEVQDISIQDHQPPANPQNSPYPDDQIISPDWSPLYNQGHVLNPSGSFQGYSISSPLALDPPSDTNEDLSFYDTPLGNKSFTSQPPSQKPTQYPENIQHGGNKFSQLHEGQHSFLNSEIGFDHVKTTNQGGTQDLFSDGSRTPNSETPTLGSSQSLPTNAPHSVGQIKTHNSLFMFPNYIDSTNNFNLGMNKSSQSTYASIPSGQQNNNPTNYDSDELDREDSPVDHELPAEIFWRRKCPLKLVGNREDSFCKACLHYGHDKRSQCCLVNVVRTAIATNKHHEVLAVGEAIKELEAGVRWQKDLPDGVQCDGSITMHMIRCWNKTAEKLRKEADDHARINVDFRDPKRYRPQDSFAPFRQQQAAATRYQIQMDHQIEHFTPDATRSLEGQLPQPCQPQSPRWSAPGSQPMQNQTQNWMHPPFPPQQNFFPSLSSSQQTFGQNFFQGQSFHQQQEAVAAAKGWAIDYSRMDSNLFSQIKNYIITDGNSDDGYKLRVNNQNMPPMLIVAIREYVLPEDNVQQSATSQSASRQQYYLQSQASPSSIHFKDIGQYYNNQMQNPKRKRN